jgi:hypothetical protein
MNHREVTKFELDDMIYFSIQINKPNLGDHQFCNVDKGSIYLLFCALSLLASLHHLHLLHPRLHLNPLQKM